MFIKANETLMIFFMHDGKEYLAEGPSGEAFSLWDAMVQFDSVDNASRAVRFENTTLTGEDITEELTQSIPADDTIKANERSMSHPERFL